MQRLQLIGLDLVQILDARVVLLRTDFCSWDKQKVGFVLYTVVELRGFKPLASAMRMRRSIS